jgi:hypothetical protein
MLQKTKGLGDTTGDVEMVFISLVNIWDYFLNCQENKTSTASASGFKEFYFYCYRTSKVIAHHTTYGGRRYSRVQATEMSHNYDMAHHGEH